MAASNKKKRGQQREGFFYIYSILRDARLACRHARLVVFPTQPEKKNTLFPPLVGRKNKSFIAPRDFPS